MRPTRDEVTGGSLHLMPKRASALLSALASLVSGRNPDNTKFTLPVEIGSEEHAVAILAGAPASDTGQPALAVRVISQLGVGSGGGGGGLTDTQLRAAPVPVSGALTNGELRAAPVPVSGTLALDSASLAALETITAQGPLTDAQLRAAALAVSGPLTDAQLRASGVPVSGPLTDGQLRATPLPVSGPLTDVQIRASPLAVSLGSSQGKTNVLRTGTLTSVAATADQVILAYTVTAGKTFYLQYLKIDVRLTTFAATATNFGEASLESPAGTKLFTQMNAGSGISLGIPVEFAEPIPIPAGTVIRIVCTPSAATSFTWRANMGGFEK